VKATGGGKAMWWSQTVKKRQGWSPGRQIGILNAISDYIKPSALCA